MAVDSASPVVNQPVKKNQFVVTKPWGYELIYALTSRYAGKILHVIKGKQLSLQRHKVKDESMYVLKGKIVLTFNAREYILNEGNSVHIPAATVHRVYAIEEADILEVSTPELDDVVRLADDYGRAGVK
jgi:mannose-6-phosphate isomerase